MLDFTPRPRSYAFSGAPRLNITTEPENVLIMLSMKIYFYKLHDHVHFLHCKMVDGQMECL